ncbi:MAG TPA: bifunctional GNAT family N-acetyltransferase/hotdog fold thioesterase [Xanthomonadaceae bacterium]|nr:bifunctional GNAT family N-acetyltransferase/hotdog fold thioesterase [Xanthomonadaceae bacterium]
MSAPLPVSLLPSPLDSARFGLRVFRGNGTALREREFFDALVADQVDVAIVRTPAGTGGWQRLARYGLQPIHADTLVYYEIDLGAHDPRPPRNADLVFAEALPSDREALAALVATTFAGYVSHYHANPLFAPAGILAGYMEWATGFIAADVPGRTTWVARRDGAIVAFACCSHDEASSQCEGVLYGVHPDHAGGGLYGDLIRYTQAAFRERGFRRMAVSTQVWNYAVQKVWAREGFALARAYDTWHVNAMLSGGAPMVDRTLCFDAAQLARFAEATGDANPVHFDDEAARAAGFPRRISHGMLVGGELSRIFGMETPGPGTLFLRANLVFLKPLFAGQPYRLHVRNAAGGEAVGYVPAVATVSDADGALCVLCYSDLLKRS